MGLFVALLRGINVGGTGLLPMKELASLCSTLGFQSVRTYIQSGNVILESPKGADAHRKTAKELASHLGGALDTATVLGGFLDSSDVEGAIRSCLEKALAAKMGKKIDVMIRTSDEMRLVLQRNPFHDREPARVAVAFLHEAPPQDFMERVIAPGGEQMHLGLREIYIYYPDGMGLSKLKLPRNGPTMTVRNVNTVAKLVGMTGL